MHLRGDVTPSAAATATVAALGCAFARELGAHRALEVAELGAHSIELDVARLQLLLELRILGLGPRVEPRFQFVNLGLQRVALACQPVRVLRRRRGN